MRFDHLVAHRPNLIQSQGGCCVRVHHHSLVDVLPLFGERCFDGQVLNVYVRAAVGGQLWR